MSLVHYVTVGHFDPARGLARGQKPLRPIDLDLVNRLLAGYPREVAALVKIQDGYARCQWAPAPRETGQLVYAFAYRLAQEAKCVASENGRRITYPPEATEAQEEFIRPLM